MRRRGRRPMEAPGSAAPNRSGDGAPASPHRRLGSTLLVSRTRSPLPKSGVDRRRWQGATTRNSWRYSEEEQRSQRRRAAPEFGDGLRVRDTRMPGGPSGPPGDELDDAQRAVGERHGEGLALADELGAARIAPQ